MGVANHEGEAMGPSLRRIATLAALLSLCVTWMSAGSGPRAGAKAVFPGCEPAGAARLTVGRVACHEIPSRTLGGTTAFSYFIPPDCAPALHRRCPVLYLLHGFGGDLTSEMGTGPHPSSTVAALTKGPSVDPNTVMDPWSYANPSGWVPRRPIDFILVAPDGRTVPGGNGPEPWLDGFWGDWNPRYAKGGDMERYATPPPRFESHLLRELIPFVERRFPAGRGRDWRALLGTSLGGYGSYKIGLRHPDAFSSIGSISGAHNFLLGPGPDPVRGPDSGVDAPPAGYLQVPGIASDVMPLTSLPGPLKQFAVAFFALGDPVADQAYFRGNMPRDLALNGAAFAGSEPSLVIRGFSNDAIPRRAEDFSDLPTYLGEEAFEMLVLDMNIQMNEAFDVEGVPYQYELHPGIHSGPYWDPFVRGQLEAQYARVRHWDGGGDPPPQPDAFAYRSIDRRFTVWGWRVSVQREPTEFLTLTDVSCRAVTLHGTGTVTVTVPRRCATGVNGDRVFTADLGASGAIDDGADTSATTVHGRTVTVQLTPLGQRS
ncbi:MAG: alpha/beta hydrolase [Actinomycetota bacterium]